MRQLEWKTHFLSGAVAGYFVTGDWKGIAVGSVAAVISDLDEPKSKFGRVFFLLSMPIHHIFGHRTFTHSLLFAVLVGIILSIFTNSLVAIAGMVGVLAHILGDMITGKVQLFYPYKKWIGLRISRLNYLLIDRVTRITLGIGILFTIAIEITKKAGLM